MNTRDPRLEYNLLKQFAKDIKVSLTKLIDVAQEHAPVKMVLYDPPSDRIIIKDSKGKIYLYERNKLL